MQGTSIDYYRVLGVNESASLEEIKRRYRELSKRYHPDTPSGDEQLMAKINEAYATLSDPVKRHFYTPPKKTAPKPSTTSTQRQSRPKAQTHSYTRTAQQAAAMQEEEKSPNSWLVFLTYVLAIPLGILLVTILTPVANRIFSNQDVSGTSTTATTKTPATGSTTLSPDTGTAATLPMNTTNTPTAQNDATSLPSAETPLTTDTTQSGGTTTQDSTNSNQATTDQTTNRSRSIWGYGYRRAY